MYSRALDIDPGLIVAQNNRALCFINLGELQLAVDDATHVIEQASSKQVNKSTLVKAYFRRGSAR